MGGLAYDTVYSKVVVAKRTGELVPQPCEVCGSTQKIHAHHDDYDKPLDVRWLCMVCHRKHHTVHGHAKNRSLILQPLPMIYQRMVEPEVGLAVGVSQTILEFDRVKFAGLRVTKRVTQVNLAKALGISRQTVARWENGDSTPSIAEINAAAKELGVSGNDLVTREDA